MFEPRYLDKTDIHDKQVADRVGMEGIVLVSTAYPYGTMEEHAYLMAMPAEDGAELVAVRVHWPYGRDYSCVNVREIMTIEQATKRHMPASLTMTFTDHMPCDQVAREIVGGHDANPTQLWYDGGARDRAILVRTFDPNAEGEKRRLSLVLAGNPDGGAGWEADIVASAGIDELREWAIAEFQSSMKP